MAAKRTNKEGDLPPNYRTLAQLKQQWEKAQELKRHEKLQQEEPSLQPQLERDEEPPHETAIPGRGGPTAGDGRGPSVENGGGDACPEGKATGEGRVKRKNKSKNKRKKGKRDRQDGEREREGRNPMGEGGGVELEGKAIVKDVTCEGEVQNKVLKESEGEGNPRGERKRVGLRVFKGKSGEKNRTIERWVEVATVGVREGDRKVGKKLEIENVVVQSDRRVNAGKAEELSARYNGDRHGRRDYNGGGKGARRMKGKAREGGRQCGMGNHSEMTVKLEGSQIDNIGGEESNHSLDAAEENVVVEESDLMIEVGRDLRKVSVRENGQNYGQRGYPGGGNRSVCRTGSVGRGGVMSNHIDQTVKVESFETGGLGIEENESVVDEIIGVKESDQMAEMRRELGEPLREDGLQDDVNSLGHKGHKGGKNRTKWQNGRAGRGRGGMGYYRDRALKVEKGLKIDNVGGEKSNQKVDMVEIKDEAQKIIGVEESDPTPEVGPSVMYDEGRENGHNYHRRGQNGSGNITKWKNEIGGQGLGRGRMSYHKDSTLRVEKELDMENIGVEGTDQKVENVVKIRDAVEENSGLEKCDQTVENMLEINDADEENVSVENVGTAKVVPRQYGRVGQGGGGGGMGYHRGYRGAYSYKDHRWGNGRSNWQRGGERNGSFWVRKEDAT